MKKYFLFLLLSAVALIANAQTEVKKSDVTMVSYEQHWDDEWGSLSLKNNLSDTLREVQFRIVYLDMNGAEMDYKDFDVKKTIAPGMTRKVRVSGYEHDRRFAYYKSTSLYSEKRFKIAFTLTGYRTETEQVAEDAEPVVGEENDYESETRSDPKLRMLQKLGVMSFSMVLLIALALLALSLILYVIVAVMANARNRNVPLWLLLSFLITPLAVIVILLIVGREE